MASVDELLDASLQQLRFSPEEMRELPKGAARQTYEVAKAVFVKGNPKVWWLSLNQPGRSVDTDSSLGFDFLRSNWPPEDSVCYFIPENETDVPRVFEATLDSVIKTLGNTAGFFEYYLVSRSFRWLMAETDHNELIIVERSRDQKTPPLRKIGDFWEVDGEPIRRVVGRPRVGRNPFDVLWDLRESGRELLGRELPDDTYPDEPIRRIVGKAGAR